jgi:hypothetical protein
MAQTPTPADRAFDRDAWLQTIEPETRRAEAAQLLDLFSRATGYPARLWPANIAGFGRYAYTYDSGRSGQSLATGFSPRKAEISVYILPGYDTLGDALTRLGPHRTGAACLYVKALSKIDLDVLDEIIRRGLTELGRRWTVLPE